MNNQLQEFARITLKKGLAKCTEPQRLIFKRMYAHGDLTCGIEEVVDNMSSDKLDRAMQQVEETLGTKKPK